MTFFSQWLEVEEQSVVYFKSKSWDSKWVTGGSVGIWRKVVSGTEGYRTLLEGLAKARLGSAVGRASGAVKDPWDLGICSQNNLKSGCAMRTRLGAVTSEGQDALVFGGRWWQKLGGVEGT